MAENPERVARRQFWDEHRQVVWERIVASLQPDERWRSTSLGFEMKSLNHDPIFRCPLICMQCIGWKANGQRCTRSTCKYLALCHSHALSMYNVEVKESNHGLGLFAKKRRAATPNELPLFRQNDFIADYLGERLPHNQFHNVRYPGDNITATYGWVNPEDPPNGPAYDAACIRGLGAYANAPDLPQQPNATLIFSNQRGWPIIVALQDIMNGQEILVSYGENYQFNDVIHETKRRRIPETQMFWPYTIGMNNFPNWQIQDFIPAGLAVPPPPPPSPAPAPRAPARRGRRRRTGRYRSRTTTKRRKK